jgi:acetoin utilization deacetylase AcuC-like enzyme
MIRVTTHRDCLAHDAPGGYPEKPERLSGILDHFCHCGGFEVIEVAGHEKAERVARSLHDERYLARFERAVSRGDGLLDSADNPLSAGTHRAAWGAVAAALAAADHVAAGERGIAFAAVRPPGHHAEAAEAMGFCFLNNAALAAEHLRRRGYARVALFDFDVHHGNGTQHLFEERADVFYASIHQSPFYPGTGDAGEVGLGAGHGFTLNIPLPAGTGDAELLAAVDAKILPALERFDPEVLVLSAGFDAWAGDPLGGFRVTLDGFAELGRQLGAFARKHCRGRILVLLEGGYDIPRLPTLVEAHLRGLAEGAAEP